MDRKQNSVMDELAAKRARVLSRYFRERVLLHYIPGERVPRVLNALTPQDEGRAEGRAGRDHPRDGERQEEEEVHLE